MVHIGLLGKVKSVAAQHDLSSQELNDLEHHIMTHPLQHVFEGVLKVGDVGLIHTLVVRTARFGAAVAVSALEVTLVTILLGGQSDKLVKQGAICGEVKVALEKAASLLCTHQQIHRQS